MNRTVLAGPQPPRQATPAGPPPVRVALVDDDQILTGALRSWSRERPELRVVATAPTVDALAISPDAVDVVLLDVLLQDGTDPAGNVARLVARGYRVLVVTVVRDSSTAIATHAAGAHGYLTKDTGPEALATAVTDVASGKPYYSRELAHALLTDTRTSRPQLSVQEQAVLRFYSSGLTLEATARQLGITFHTAKGYLDRIRDKYRKAGRPAPTKVDLANRLREDGL